MKTIWKYKLETTDAQAIEMPVGAEILTVQNQSGCPCLWAMADPMATKQPRIIEIFGTGHPIEDSDIQRRHIGTYQLRDGGVVFHVFEAVDNPAAPAKSG